MSVTRSHNLSIGIVGLPNSGKSTIFNAITKSAVPAEGILILSSYWKEESTLGKLVCNKKIFIIILGIILTAGIILSI